LRFCCCSANLFALTILGFKYAGSSIFGSVGFIIGKTIGGLMIGNLIGDGDIDVEAIEFEISLTFVRFVLIGSGLVEGERFRLSRDFERYLFLSFSLRSLSRRSLFRLLY
jgi:hypothetical protein